MLCSSYACVRLLYNAQSSKHIVSRTTYFELKSFKELPIDFIQLFFFSLFNSFHILFTFSTIAHTSSPPPPYPWKFWVQKFNCFYPFYGYFARFSVPYFSIPIPPQYLHHRSTSVYTQRNFLCSTLVYGRKWTTVFPHIISHINSCIVQLYVSVCVFVFVVYYD